MASSIEDDKGALEIAWATSVGANLGKRTRLLGVEDGLLIVEVSDPSWQAALRGMARHILPRLRKALAKRAPVGLHVILASREEDSSASPKVPARSRCEEQTNSPCSLALPKTRR